MYAALSKKSDTGLVTLCGDVCLSPSFLTVIDEPSKYARVTQLMQSVFVPWDSLAQSNHDTTLELIREKSLALVNIDRSTHKDVFRLVPVHWSSTGLPLGAPSEPRGIYYVHKEIYT